MADLKLSPPPATRPVVCRAATTLPLLMLLVALLLPIRAAAHSHDILKISGCSVSRAGYLEQLTTAFSEATGIRVLLKGGGSMAGLLTLEAGAGDLAASCLPPGAGEIPAGARLVPVAGDALVFIVARNNHLDNLPLEQVRDIFLGRIANWRQLGGPEQPLRLYLTHSSQGTQGVPYTLQQQLLAGRPITVKPEIFIPRPSIGLVEESVARDVLGISVGGFTSARIKDDLKMLAVDGVTARRENIITGAYPEQLRRYLYLALPPDPSPAAERFLDFVLSGRGQELLAEIGAIPLAAFGPVPEARQLTIGD